MSIKETVRQALAGVTDPSTGKDLIASGALRGVGADGDRVAVEIRLGYPADGVAGELEATISAALDAIPEISSSVINLSWKVASHQVQAELKPLDNIRNIIAVASGKGGVGKSTTAVNLALALAADGARVGILDADIYGPSIPRMLGVSGRPDTDGKRIEPKQAHGLQLMSIGFLVEDETPMIWRGPMVTSALQQLLGETNWRDLDYLVVDLPPGTGDIQLTLSQKVPVAGAVIVTTPQDIALLDARKAYQMFRKVGVPVLGVVENMSIHVCSECGHEEAIFGSGGGQNMASDYELPLLGQLPLASEIRSSLDEGQPTVAADPDSKLAMLYRQFARRTAGELSQMPRNTKLDLPGIVVQNR
ncbi:MAG: iron-sulfur cluster carrier protein ApbC [Xanthomonadales bacterium]|nr:iron-sulfur cluster carrier protein ApbC [Xanthomonadales bacterium]NNL96111.1 iron-sulfur cluster carrier protein ApbC [Xanthomonadales bacterium]